MILMLPIGVLIMVALFVRLHRRRIEKKCIKPSNHGNFAGVILTAMFVMIYIIIMDTLAVIAIFTNTHEYSDYDINGSLNFYVVVITFALDIFAMLYSFAAWTLFVGWTCSYRNCSCHNNIISCFRNSLKCLFVPFLYLVFGYKKHDKFWKEEDYQTDRDDKVTETVFAVRQVWALLSLLIGPLFGTFSHLGYILVAWLTEPHKTSSIFVLMIVILIYLYTLFRAIFRSSERYSTLSKLSDKRTGRQILSFLESFFHCCIVCCANFNCNCTKDLESIDLGEEYELENVQNSITTKIRSNKTIIFSKARLLSTFIVGMIASIPLALTLIGFSYVHLPALDLADHLEHAVMIGLVIFATLATHRILSLKEPDLTVLVKKFKDSYETKRVPNRKLSENLFEACGEIAGEVCQSLHKNRLELSQYQLHLEDGCTGNSDANLSETTVF